MWKVSQWAKEQGTGSGIFMVFLNHFLNSSVAVYNLVKCDRGNCENV